MHTASPSSLPLLLSPSGPPGRVVLSSTPLVRVILLLSISPLTRVNAHTATIVTFVAFVMSLVPNVFAMLLGALTAWLAALLTLIAFFCDIALFAYFSTFTTPSIVVMQVFDPVKPENKMDDLGDAQPSSNPGPGFWMTFVVRISISLPTLYTPCTVRMTLLVPADILPPLLCGLCGALRPQEGTPSPWG